MKNLSEAKRLLVEGTKVKIYNTLKNSISERIVVESRTSHIYTGTELENMDWDEYYKFPNNFHFDSVKGSYYSKIRCDWQPAKTMTFEKNKIHFHAYSNKYGMIPSTEYKSGEIWLTIEIMEDK